jgi:hypothetical protein
VDVKFQFSLTMWQTPLLDPLLDWVKIVALETVGDVTTEYPLGVFRLSMPQEALGPYSQKWQLKGYDRTIQLVQDKFSEAYAVAAGSNPLEEAKTICVSAGIPESMIRFPSTDKLVPTALAWAQGTAKLRAVNDLMATVGAYSVWADANGFLTTRVPVALETESPARAYRTGQAGIVVPPAERQRDDTGIANRVVVTVKDPQMMYSIIASLADVNHPLHPSRLGYTRTNLYDLPAATDVGVAEEYARRRLEEGLSFYTTATIKTFFDFGRAGNAFEVYELDLRDKDGNVLMDGNWRVKGWSMDLQTSGRMTHELRRVESIGGQVDVSQVFMRMDVNVFENLSLQDDVGVA